MYAIVTQEFQNRGKTFTKGDLLHAAEQLYPTTEEELAGKVQPDFSVLSEGKAYVAPATHVQCLYTRKEAYMLVQSELGKYVSTINETE